MLAGRVCVGACGKWGRGRVGWGGIIIFIFIFNCFFFFLHRLLVCCGFLVRFEMCDVTI